MMEARFDNRTKIRQEIISAIKALIKKIKLINFLLGYTN